MCGDPHEVFHAAHGQPGVSIDSQHITDVPRKPQHVIGVRQEAGRSAAQQQAVQFLELAALALPAHVAALAIAPQPAPMQQEEPGFLAPRAEGLLVQCRDFAAGCVQDRSVVVPVPGGAVGPVREQRKADAWIGIRECMDLQLPGCRSRILW